MNKIFEVVFEKYKGTTVLIIADNFAQAVRTASEWSEKHKYGKEIHSIEIYGTVDANAHSVRDFDKSFREA